MSLRIIPADTHSKTYTHIPSTHNVAPSAPGLHDTLRAGVAPSPLNTPEGQAISAHPLESRLKAWEATREQLRMETLRRTYGIAEPVRRGMELKITKEGSWTPMCLAGNGASGSVHEEILRGRDGIIEWEDVYTGSDEEKLKVGIHDEIERKVKMGL
ncbi:putative proteasome maturation factor UMP1 [Cladorrhinum samala]|uniref:Proteasome maturation factor UMP1 n=1 Tax=Cladorrhinum samala TaxID=585594 RepID=A0AAV9HHY8_9PEZI|nr:putative proteasome maturation factor UMP1 [Cladorrhinum samala]